MLEEGLSAWCPAPIAGHGTQRLLPILPHYAGASGVAAGAIYLEKQQSKCQLSVRLVSAPGIRSRQLALRGVLVASCLFLGVDFPVFLNHHCPPKLAFKPNSAEKSGPLDWVE